MAEALTDRVGPAPGPARDVLPSQVEQGLGEAWREAAGEGPDSPVRARMSNLVVYCATPDALARVGEELPRIVRAHPSRVLVLAGDPRDRDVPVDATVAAIMHVAGDGRRVGSEHVFLRASGAATEGLPAAVRPLLITDLPTVLWWTPTDQAPPRFGSFFDALAEMADHLVYESRGWLDPVREIVATARWATGNPTHQVITDLAWRRLEPWRRLLAQVLDPTVAPGGLAGIEDIVVEHGPHALPKAWMLVAWLAHSLGWTPAQGSLSPGVETTWSFLAGERPVRVTIRRHAEGEPEIERLSVGWRHEGTRRCETLERLGPERLGVTAPLESPRVLSIPPRSRAALLASELPNRRGHALFAESLSLARVMAEAMTEAPVRSLP